MNTNQNWFDITAIDWDCQAALDTRTTLGLAWAHHHLQICDQVSCIYFYICEESPG